MSETTSNAEGRFVGTGTRGPVRALITTKDWSSTPLGPMEQWPSSLHNVLRLMLDSRYSMWMGWGSDLYFFCNDAYREQTLGEKYKWAIGEPFRIVWAEIWEVLRPRIEHVLSTGEATWDEGLLLFLERDGYPEETYHTFSYSPAPSDEPDQVGGLFCVVFEETHRVIGERRIATLGAFASLLAKTNTTGELFSAVTSCLATDSKDISFFLAYLFNDDKSAVLVASGGFAEGHPAAPSQAVNDAVWPLSVVRDGGMPMVVELPSNVEWPTGAWKVQPRRALIVPIARQGESRPAGVFVAGLNPHRPLDDGIRNFVGLLVGQLAAGLSNVIAFEEAKNRAESLAELDRAKTAFFSNVSHEFRTPLTLMLAPIEDMLSLPMESGEDRDRVTLLHRNTLRLLKLVNTLLDFSRIEAGRVEAVYEETDLAAFTTDLASNFRSAIERAGLTFTVDCPPLPESIYIDRTMWEKIVLNLLSNAFKFTFEGGIAVHLRFIDSQAELQVADTGIGIAEQDLPRLFERFHRIEGARSRSHEGSGIGLALVNDLVRMQGGEVRVTSRPGEGTTFAIQIPRGRKHLVEARIRKGRSLQSTAVGAGAYVEEALRWIGSEKELGKPTTVESAVNRPRIVLADDNADMLEYVTRLLREQWDVEPVRDGRAALEAIQKQPPDLVISDVMMPELDGFGLLKAIRESAGLRSLPVILLSARAGEEATEEGLKAGADDYIVKPFTARDLLVRVTARLGAAKAARDAIQQRDNIYRHFSQAPFPITILREPNRIIELANAPALESWGLSNSQDVVGRSLMEVLPFLSETEFPALLDKVCQTGDPWEGHDLLVQFPSGPGGAVEDRYYTIVYAPLFDKERRVEGILTCGFDVTATVLIRRQGERATKDAALVRDRALREAEETNVAKDEFLATMSHELRTPLNAMLGWATLLKSDLGDPVKLRRGLDTIERNAKTQSRLIEDLLDVSRIISGKLSLVLARVQVSAAIYAAADVVRPAAEAKGVRLVIDLDPDVGALVADPDRLQQIVWNLLSNAVRFTPSKGRVTVSAKRDSSAVTISVTDTGRGIAAEHIAYIFDRFRQVDSSITRAHSGLGLGLAIVRHLVEAHGGKVAVVSDGLGEGALFSVTLPIQAVDISSIPKAEESGPKAVSAERDIGTRATLVGIRMLVVDDEVDSLDLIRVVLEGAGATVTVAATAAEALSAAGPFDIIVSDIGMPEVDGYTFLQRVRSAGSSVPAIALTAYARAEDAERAKRAGFQEHLAKPVEVGKLLETVRKWVESNKTLPQ